MIIIMAPDINACFRTLTDTQLMALCIYGEARGESLAGKIAVAHTIMNRVKLPKWWGRTIQDVILKPKQFSCFNDGSKNRLTLRAIAADWDRAFQRNRVLRECYLVAEGVIEGDIRDNTDGATHYNTIDCDPSWDDAMVRTDVIGNHEFYKEA